MRLVPLAACKKRKSWYAVRVGRKPGIYTNWDECKEQVKHCKRYDTVNQQSFRMWELNTRVLWTAGQFQIVSVMT